MVDLYHAYLCSFCYTFFFPDPLSSPWPFVGEKLTHILCLSINLDAKIWGKRLCYMLVQHLAQYSFQSFTGLLPSASASTAYGSPLPSHLKVLLWSWLIKYKPETDKLVHSSHFNHFPVGSKACSWLTVLAVAYSQGQPLI